MDKLGSIYVSGRTDGALAGASNGSSDAFLSRLDPSGNTLWTRQLGSRAGDSSWNVMPDDFGNVFIVGQTFGNMAGVNGGLTDVFVSKYDATGTLAWTRQFGASNNDTGLGLASDGQGGVYVSGILQAFFGYVSRFDGSGNQVWHQRLDPTSFSDSSGVAVDEVGSLYVLGSTEGSPGWPHAGARDVFVRKYSSSGVLLWRQHLGSSADDYGFDLTLDGSGRIYVSGQTEGDLGSLNAGESDIFITSLNSSGQFRWTRQFGTAGFDGSRGVSVDGLGSIYLSGATTGVLGTTSAGSTDAFVLKIAEVPEPSALVSVILAILSLSHRRRSGLRPWSSMATEN